MKKLLFLFTFLFFLAACNVLDVEPLSSIPASEAFKDKAGIQRGILGAYSSLQSLSYYGRNFGIFGDLAGDNLLHPLNATSADYNQVANHAILPENTAIDGLWTILYDGINIANNVIAQVPNIPDMTTGEQEVALGELYFIRALNHFNLVNCFGAVPIKTTPTIGVDKVDAARDNVDAVYAQIISDLKYAEQKLPASGTKVRASKYAAKALLARVYLYKNDYANAGISAGEVIAATGYSLLPNYADVFSDESLESIFEIDFNELDRNRIAEYNFPLALNGRGEVAPSPDLLAQYEAGDERQAATIATAGTNKYAVKYRDLSTGGDNFVVIRLAEMYLIAAEATAKGGGSVAQVKIYLDPIRTRANLTPIDGNTADDLIAPIEKERRLEFAMEGHRWFDLVRTGRALDVLPTVTNLNQTLFPIPLSELITNNNPGMKQNPGY